MARRKRGRWGSLAQGTAAEGEGCHFTKAFPIPLGPGLGGLMGSLAPPPGSREASDWLGR